MFERELTASLFPSEPPSHGTPPQINGKPLRFAYADPPYLGQAKKHYGEKAREVNHDLLIKHLETFDGWALSCSSPSLPAILPLCPPCIRIMAWVKPFCSFKPGVNPAYAWEPVIVKVGRKLGRDVDTLRDFVSENITLKRGLTGAKPEKFCTWLFGVMGMQPGDDFTDVFPGTGAVCAAFQKWNAPALAATSNPGSENSQSAERKASDDASTNQKDGGVHQTEEKP